METHGDESAMNFSLISPNSDRFPGISKCFASLECVTHPSLLVGAWPIGAVVSCLTGPCRRRVGSGWTRLPPAHHGLGSREIPTPKGNRSSCVPRFPRAPGRRGSLMLIALEFSRPQSLVLSVGQVPEYVSTCGATL